jgi:multiple sugar transport system substrate-binding protein
MNTADDARRVSRRRFLANTRNCLALAGLAPAISAPFIARARAADKTLKIIQFSHFVPAYDKWFDAFAKDWGEKNGVEVTVDHAMELPARAAAEATAQAGHDLFGFLGSGGPHLYIKQLLDLSPLVDEMESKYGKVQPIGRQIAYDSETNTWPAFPGLLCPISGSLPQGPVGRDRYGTGYLGGHPQGWRQAQGQGLSDRHQPRPQ